jgi:hypothetical protein
MPQSAYPAASAGVTINSGLNGAGSPEGAVTAGVGTTYTDVSVDPPSFWVKEYGAGNTGWRQLIA